MDSLKEHMQVSMLLKITLYISNNFRELRGIHRVWKGILGIRDLTKIRCGIRENEKYLDGIRDLTATMEAGFAKILGREAGFCCLSVGNSGNRHDPNKRYGGKSESTMRAQNINRKDQLLQKLVFFHAFLGKKKRNSGKR